MQLTKILWITILLCLSRSQRSLFARRAGRPPCVLLFYKFAVWKTLLGLKLWCWDSSLFRVRGSPGIELILGGSHKSLAYCIVIGHWSFISLYLKTIKGLRGFWPSPHVPLSLILAAIFYFILNPVYIPLQTGIKMRSLMYYEYRRCSWWLRGLIRQELRVVHDFDFWYNRVIETPERTHHVAELNWLFRLQGCTDACRPGLCTSWLHWQKCLPHT